MHCSKCASWQANGEVADVSEPAMEVIEDSWTKSDDFIHRSPVMAREPLQLLKELSLTTLSTYVLAVRHRKTKFGREYHRQLWTQNSPRQLERIHAIHAMSHPQQCPAEGVDGYLADGSETKSPQGHYRSGKKSCRPCPTVLRGNNRSNGRVIKQNTSCTSEEEKTTSVPNE